MRLCGIFFIICIFSMSSYAADYQLGEAYNIGSMNVSGYSNLILNVPNTGNTQLALDELSLFLSGRFNRFKVQRAIGYVSSDTPVGNNVNVLAKLP